MAYSDPAKYREARERWRAANREKDRASKLASAERRRHYKRAQENEKAFRFEMWEVARVKNSEFWEFTSMVTRKQLENPEFIFKYQGRTVYENLRSPLPIL
jgi:hypothetical protein